jgi:hypothetical protein
VVFLLCNVCIWKEIEREMNSKALETIEWTKYVCCMRHMCGLIIIKYLQVSVTPLIMIFKVRISSTSTIVLVENNIYENYNFHSRIKLSAMTWHKFKVSWLSQILNSTFKKPFIFIHIRQLIPHKITNLTLILSIWPTKKIL